MNYRWENLEKKRYYTISFSRDLFGDWVITRVWGGIGKATGRITHLPCASYEDGLKQIEKIARIRVNRGYVICIQGSIVSEISITEAE